MIKTEASLFVWGTGAEPSAALVEEYKNKKARYDKYVEEYRKTHNGDLPPPPQLLTLKLEMIDPETSKENTELQ
jgi:uncharacterized protein YeaO (DUF488 family)